MKLASTTCPYSHFQPLTVIIPYQTWSSAPPSRTNLDGCLFSSKAPSKAAALNDSKWSIKNEEEKSWKSVSAEFYIASSILGIYITELGPFINLPPSPRCSTAGKISWWSLRYSALSLMRQFMEIDAALLLLLLVASDVDERVEQKCRRIHICSHMWVQTKNRLWKVVFWTWTCLWHSRTKLQQQARSRTNPSSSNFAAGVGSKK